MLQSILLLLTLAAGNGGEALEQDPQISATQRLGERLFHETRFSSPAADMATGCASCHQPADAAGDRAFTELLARSWQPWRSDDPVRDTLRNTPTLMDVAAAPRLHYDGEFSSLEEQAHLTLIGRNFGWLPGESEKAAAHVAGVIRDNEEYLPLFAAAFGDDALTAADATLLDHASTAIADFMHTLRSPRQTPYDEFVRLNGLPEAPQEGETPDAFAHRVMTGVRERAYGSGLIRPRNFNLDALHGMRLFLTTDGSNAGNCVACHTPPNFTDHAFRNAGVAQAEYDALHGDGAFAALAVPDLPRGPGGNNALRQRAARDSRDLADLGYWNYADPATSPFRRNAETVEAYRKRSIAAVKTPTLRHLGSTDPYMHNGAYRTIEAALLQHIKAAHAARAGTLRNVDPELARMTIGRESIMPLFAFLNTLNEPTGRRAIPESERDDVGTGASNPERYPRY
ncbi:MAG: cytochrome c peroxidase [Candidatus Hydrogenedentales bacterium]